MTIYIYVYVVRSITFQNFLVQALKIVVDSWKFNMYYEMTDQFLWFQSQMNSYSRNWNKPYLSRLVNLKNAIWTLEERYAITFCFKLEKNAMRWKLDLLLWPRDQETDFPVEACWLSQTPEGQTEQIHPQTFDDPFFWLHCMIYIHWVPTEQTVNKEYYVGFFLEFRKRFRRKRPALFKSGQRHFRQDNAPVPNCILVTDY